MTVVVVMMMAAVVVLVVVVAVAMCSSSPGSRVVFAWLWLGIPDRCGAGALGRAGRSFSIGGKVSLSTKEMLVADLRCHDQGLKGKNVGRLETE